MGSHTYVPAGKTELLDEAVPDCTTGQYQVKTNSTRLNGKRLLTQTPIHRNQLRACFHLSVGRCQTGIRNTSLKILSFYPTL